jgi:hypothetical protein
LAPLQTLRCRSPPRRTTASKPIEGEPSEQPGHGKVEHTEPGNFTHPREHERPARCYDVEHYNQAASAKISRVRNEVRPQSCSDGPANHCRQQHPSDNHPEHAELHYHARRRSPLVSSRKIATGTYTGSTTKAITRQIHVAKWPSAAGTWPCSPHQTNASMN